MLKLLVCQSGDVEEGGLGYRFKVLYNGVQTTAFVVRLDNVVHSFLNRCAHLPVELDWNYGEFFDDSGRVLVCATHGASYDAVDGRCLGGPCDGAPLVQLNIQEENGGVYWTPSQTITVPEEGIKD